MDAIGGEAKTLRRSIAYPVLFTDSAGILQIARPGQAQRSAFKVTIREHVGQAERVVIFLCQSGQWDGIDGSITVRDARQEQKDEKKNQRNCRKVAGWRKLTGKQLEVFLDAVVARETVVGLVEGLICVHFNALDHEVDVVWLSVSVKICGRRRDMETAKLDYGRKMARNEAATK